MNSMPGDGYTIVGVNLPHIVLQPLEPETQFKTEDITPVYFFHYTPDAVIVAADSPFKTFADLVQGGEGKARGRHDRRIGHQLGESRRRRCGSIASSGSRPRTCRSRAPAT